VKILLIEDDAETAAHIERGLREAAHEVRTVTDGGAAIDVAVRTQPELLIVDRMLPGRDGIEVVKTLRARGLNAPVLFLTALNTVADRVEGLEAGADDYLAKPFSLDELRARIQALARRPPLAEQPMVLEVGDLRIDRLKRSVTRGGTPIDLQPREYQLLEYLLAHAGSVITRTMLLEEIWGFHFDPGTNIVETHICRIRAKIDRGGDPPLIDTLRGVGYRVCVE